MFNNITFTFSVRVYTCTQLYCHTKSAITPMGSIACVHAFIVTMLEYLHHTEHHCCIILPSYICYPWPNTTYIQQMQSDLPPTQSLSSPSILHLHPMALLHTSPEEQCYCCCILHWQLTRMRVHCRRKIFGKKKKNTNIQASKQARTQTEISPPNSLVWGSLRLAPIITCMPFMPCVMSTKGYLLHYWLH